MTKENKPGSPPSKEEIQAVFGRVKEIDLALAPLNAERQKLLNDVRERIKASGLPAEAKLLAGAVMHDQVSRRLEYLVGLSEAIEVNRGGLIVWTDSKEETTVFRDPGPNLTETNWYLHFGKLPQDADLDIGRFGEAGVPVDEYMSVQLHAKPVVNTQNGWGSGWLDDFHSASQPILRVSQTPNNERNRTVRIGKQEIEALRSELLGESGSNLLPLLNKLGFDAIIERLSVSDS